MFQALDKFLSRLKELRKRHNVTQEEFSEISGIAYKYYQALEGGRKRDIRLFTVERVARTYGIQVYQLLAPTLPETKLNKKRSQLKKS